MSVVQTELTVRAIEYSEPSCTRDEVRMYRLKCAREQLEITDHAGTLWFDQLQLRPGLTATHSFKRRRL